MRISQRSIVSLPSPSGDFLHDTFSFFVGSGTGPRISTPVRWEIPFIWLHTLSTFCGSVPLSEILARCDMFITNFQLKKERVYLFSTVAHIPAATVCPMSLIANLPSCGNSFAASMTIGFVGSTFTIAMSPVFKNCGFFSFA